MGAMLLTLDHDQFQQAQEAVPDAEADDDAVAAIAPLFADYFDALAVELCLAAGFDGHGRLVHFSGGYGDRARNGDVLLAVRAVLASPRVGKLIIAHNHPCGDARWSRKDVASTRRVAALCRMAGVDLCDHLLFAGPIVASFRASGLL
jgi:hypothetical protein